MTGRTYRPRRRPAPHAPGRAATLAARWRHRPSVRSSRSCRSSTRCGTRRTTSSAPCDSASAACEDLIESGDIADYELIIIDDKSTDRTPEIADAMAAADPHVRVIHHDRNRKLGGSMKTGFAAATGDLVLYTDADLPFDMDELPRAVRLLREYEVDIISAYRLRPHRRGLAPLRLHVRLQRR